MYMQQLQLQLRLEKDVINGFSYSFAKALLDRLNELFKADTLYEKTEQDIPSKVASLTLNLIHYLDDQIPHCDWTKITMENFRRDDWEEVGKIEYVRFKIEVKEVIDNAYDFLSTFEYEHLEYTQKQLDFLIREISAADFYSLKGVQTYAVIRKNRLSYIWQFIPLIKGLGGKPLNVGTGSKSKIKNWFLDNGINIDNPPKGLFQRAVTLAPVQDNSKFNFIE